MSYVTSELVELVGLLCDDELSPEQTARLGTLVGESAEAQQYVLESFQIHCELGWEFGRKTADGCPSVASVGAPPASPALPVAAPSGQVGLPRWAIVAAAAAVLIAVTLGLTKYFGARGVRDGRPDELGSSTAQSPAGQSVAHPTVAHIEKMVGIRWSDDRSGEVPAAQPAGGKLAIRQGLLQVRFDSGATIIVQGPAEVELESSSSAALRAGSLTADVPAAARGFTVHTPNATIVDLGTRFGAACQAGQTDVEVFAGNVMLRPLAAQGANPQELRMEAHNAVRISGSLGGPITVKPIAAGERNFVRSMSGSAAALRALMASDSHLIHFYPFEGATDKERLRDCRGNLDLVDVPMRDGDGGGRIEFTRTGPDTSVQVVAPFRAGQAGTTHGRGLQSRSAFPPPSAMTVELLLNLSSVGKTRNEFLASAVAMRHDRDHCGFLVAATGDGELACLLAGDADWLHSGFKLVPGRWYYVALTFQAKNGNTAVNAYAADLSNKHAALNQIVRDQTVPGVAASGRLCIGKGFDGEMASAYPWPGRLGQIAVYDTTLDRGTIESHLAVLTGDANAPAESVPAK
jgi:hypothetical protein